MDKNREFDVVAASEKVRTRTANLCDFEVLNEKVARVVISHTGGTRGRDFLTQVANLFTGLATPIKHSFSDLTDRAAVGFISAKHEVREFDELAEHGKYRAIASNLLMDKEDKSTWSVKEGASGKYLTKQGVEDLSELATSIVSRRTGVPLIASLSFNAIAEREFIAFVDIETAAMDYGYSICEGKTPGTIVVLSTTDNEPKEVSAATIVRAWMPGKQRDLEGFGKELAFGMDKKGVIEYYRKAYPYAPEYVEEIIKTVNDMSFA